MTNDQLQTIAAHFDAQRRDTGQNMQLLSRGICTSTRNVNALRIRAVGLPNTLSCILKDICWTLGVATDDWYTRYLAATVRGERRA